MMLIKHCTHYASKFGELINGHRTGKGQFSFQSQRKAMPKNVQVTIELTHFTCQHDYAQNPSSWTSAVHELRTSRHKAGFTKRGTRDQIANICWIIGKAREFQENIYYYFIDYAKALTVWITTNCGKFFNMEIPEHLPCLLRNLYEGQKATVRTRHGTMDWLKTGKGVGQGCILLPCILNF